MPSRSHIEHSAAAARKMWEDRARSARFWDGVAAPALPPPTGLVQFALRFSNDDVCREYLYKRRWPNGFVCTTCGDTKGYLIHTRNSVECSNRHQTSLTAGTAMHHTQLPLHKWFYAAWLLTTHKSGMSAVQFQREMSMTRYETAFLLLHKLRATLFVPDRVPLTSQCRDPQHTDHWIEVDEVYLGGAESGTEHRGRGADTKSLVVIAVEVHAWKGGADPRDLVADGHVVRRERKGKQAFHRRAGRARMQIIHDASMPTLMDFVARNIAPGSTIWTDGHKGYLDVGPSGFPHRVTIAKYDPDPLPTLGRVTTNLKRWLIGTHKGAVQPQHMQNYLNEYIFRFNRRDMPWVAFDRALGLTMVLRPSPQRRTLFGGAWEHRQNPRQGGPTK